MTERQEERYGPEEKATQPDTRSPGFEKVSGVPDPSGDTEITESDRENPLVNDSSFEDAEDKER